MKTRILLTLLVISVVSICYAEDETENITLTAYYPAPYGEYTNLETVDFKTERVEVAEYIRLMPSNTAPNLSSLDAADKKGIMYYDETDGIKYFDGINWQSAFGGGSSGLGNWQDMSGGTIYEASTDGFVLAYYYTYDACTSVTGYTGSNSDPITIRAKSSRTVNSDQDYKFIMMPVKKGDYWKVIFDGVSSAIKDAHVRWISLE